MFKWFFVALLAFDIWRVFYPAIGYNVLIVPAATKYISVPVSGSQAQANKIAAGLRSQLPQSLQVDVVKANSTFFDKRDIVENPQNFLTLGK